MLKEEYTKLNITHYICDSCESEFKFTGKKVDNQYEHKCNGCGEIIYLDCEYPLLTHLPINDNVVNIVRIETIRHFDECQYSYLPLMNDIMGVYNSINDAKNAVWRYFGDDKYEYITDNDIIYDIAPYSDTLFKYTDQKYGGVAYYAIYYYTESVLTEENK